MFESSSSSRRSGHFVSLQDIISIPLSSLLHWLEGHVNDINALHCAAIVLIIRRLQHVTIEDAPNPFIILKITSPMKTPDTTTAFDGDAVVCSKPVQLWGGKQPLPPPISKPKEPMTVVLTEAI